MPLLSLAIPTFNRSKSLEKCLSLVGPVLQEHQPLVELLILDNHSTDDTPAVVADFVSRWQGQITIRTIRRPENIGFSRNLLDAIEIAEGDYFMFIGDDDQLDRVGFSRALGLIQSNPAPSAVIQVDFPDWGHTNPSTARVLPSKLLPYFFFAGNAWASIIRRDLVQIFMEDEDLRSKLSGNIWPQTFLIFAAMLSNPDMAPWSAGFKVGSIIGDRWITEPDKRYMIRIIKDLLQIAIWLSEELNVKAQDFYVNPTRNVLDYPIDLLLQITVRDLDSSRVNPLLDALNGAQLSLSPARTFFLRISHWPRFLYAATMFHCFATRGPRAVAQYILSVRRQRENYKKAVSSAEIQGTRVSNFF